MGALLLYSLVLSLSNTLDVLSYIYINHLFLLPIILLYTVCWTSPLWLAPRRFPGLPPMIIASMNFPEHTLFPFQFDWKVQTR